MALGIKNVLKTGDSDKNLLSSLKSPDFLKSVF